MSKIITLDNLNTFLASIREEIDSKIAAAIEDAVPTDSHIKSIVESTLTEKYASNAAVENLFDDSSGGSGTGSNPL